MKYASPKHNQSSINATAVANTVAQKVRAGKLVQFKEILLKQGYSPSVANAPTKVTRTKTYINAMKPIVKQMEELRQKIVSEMQTRDLNDVNYSHLTDALDKLTKNIQLLNGGTTDNVALTVQISEAIAKKNNIQPVGIISTPTDRVLTASTETLVPDTEVT